MNSAIGERQILPWQMNSTFIIVLFLLDLPRNALFCKGFRRFVKCLILLASWQNRARWSKLLRAVSSKISSKRERLTTKKKEEEQVFLHISRYLRTHAKLLLDCFLILKHAVLVHSNDYHILALQT